MSKVDRHRARLSGNAAALLLATSSGSVLAEEVTPAPSAPAAQADAAPAPAAPVAKAEAAPAPSAPTSVAAAASAPAAQAPPAQTPSTSPPPCEPDEDEASEGFGEFLAGPALINLSSLNDHLAANGYERLSSVMVLLGGEGHGVMPSGFVVGARGAGVFGPSANGPDGVQTHLSGGFGMVDFGFAFVHRPNLLLTLTGGLGGYGMTLGIGDGQSARFDDVLKNPKRSTSMDVAGLLVGLTLGIDGRVPIGKVERGRRGFFTIGLRVAGLWGPPIGGWDLAGGDNATAGPNTGLTGGYAALAIGFGGGSVKAPGTPR